MPVSYAHFIVCIFRCYLICILFLFFCSIFSGNFEHVFAVVVVVVAAALVARHPTNISKLIELSC